MSITNNCARQIAEAKGCGDPTAIAPGQVGLFWRKMTLVLMDPGISWLTRNGVAADFLNDLCPASTLVARDRLEEREP